MIIVGYPFYPHVFSPNNQTVYSFCFYSEPYIQSKSGWLLSSYLWHYCISEHTLLGSISLQITGFILGKIDNILTPTVAYIPHSSTMKYNQYLLFYFQHDFFLFNDSSMCYLWQQIKVQKPCDVSFKIIYRLQWKRVCLSISL